MAGYFERLLTDGSSDLYEDEYEISSDNFPSMGGPDWCISKLTLKGGKQHGVDVVAIENGCLTVVVCPTRGMGILEAFTEEVMLGWDSPVKEVVHPAYVAEESRGLLGWLEGFTELVCRCGLAYHGAPGEDVVLSNTGAETRIKLPLHGTIANTPASRVAVMVDLEPPHTLSVAGEMYDTQMFGSCYRLLSTVSTVPGSSEFTVSDVVENLGGTNSELELLYHCNYGPPVLGEGARLLAPASFVCPRDAEAQKGMAAWGTYGPPRTGFAEQCYFLRMHADGQGRTLVALVDPEKKLAATVRYSVEQLPAFTIWRNTAAEADGYVTGLEPGTDYPNQRAFERQKGRVIEVPPGGTYETQLTFGLVTGAEQVAELEREVASLAEGKESATAEEPHPDYCPP